MPSYAPNAFAGGGAPTAQRATSSALRSYAPNPLSGGNQPRVTSMAPHLSVAAADRPFAEDIAMLQSAPEYASKVPGNLDQMWRQSPQSYQSQVANMLRQPGPEGALVDLRDRKQVGTTREIYDDNGNPITQTYAGGGDWRRPGRNLSGGD